MGDFDFLGGFDFGDLGGGIAGAGGNVPNLQGVGDFTIPNMNFPNWGEGGGAFNFPPSLGGDQSNFGGFNFGQQLYDPQQGAGFTLPPGQGVMAPGQPTPPQQNPTLLQQLLGAGGGAGQGVIKDITSLGGLGLGALGIKNQIDALGLAKKQQGQQNQLQEVTQKSAQPLQQFGVQQLGQASAGRLDPAVEAMIAQWAQAQKIKMQQQFAHMGITDSTMMQQALAQIDQQSVAMKAQMLGMDKTQAIQALQAAMQGANAGVGQANAEQQQLDSLIAASNRALAALTGAAV